MYEIIKSVIQSKDYELREMLYKINKMYIESAITEAEKTELDELARQNAVAENSYASTNVQMKNIYKEIDDLKSRVSLLENKDSTEESPEEPNEPVSEYPEYKQPTGAHDSYKNGDKITYKGKKYICKMDNCVWSPDEYPAAWGLVESEEQNG